MGRLIDADVLCKMLKEDIGDCDYQYDLEFYGVYDIIANTPTAYDVDKVIEELEDRLATEKDARAEYILGVNGFSQRLCESSISSYTKAIEIVKRGGIHG
jgi:hypothetical protein